MTVSANPSEEMKYRYRNALQILAPKLFPASGDRKQLVEDWAKTTSIVIVRHPLARLGARTPNFRIHPMCKLKCRFQLFVLKRSEYKRGMCTQKISWFNLCITRLWTIFQRTKTALEAEMLVRTLLYDGVRRVSG